MAGLCAIGHRIVAVGLLLCVLAPGIPATRIRLPRESAPSSATTHHRLPDTGLAASFTTTFGEDCDYTINPPSFTDNGDGTVTDNITGLIWQKADGSEMTWENAGSYAKALRLGNWTDWRLPTNHELFSLLNHSGNPALDASYFTMSAAEYWWTCDTLPGDTSTVWVANAGGGTGPHPKNETISAGGSKRFHARCVRGGTSSSRPKPNFRDNGDGTITDLDTGLIWLQGEVSPTMNWEAALSYAESLSFAGYNDWRLPSVKELQSLSDEATENPSVDKTYFPGATASKYWSSTTLAGQTGRAWHVDFQYGIASYSDKTSSLLVRCVRGGTASAVPDGSAFLATELLGRVTGTAVTINAVPARSMEVYFEYGVSTGNYSASTRAVAYAAGTPIEVTMSLLRPDTQYFYRIRYRDVGDTDFNAGDEHAFHTQRPPGSSFIVGIQADPHMDENSDAATYSLTMQNMLAEKPDFMVDLGDTFMSDKLPSPTYSQIADRALLLRSYYDIACHSVPLFMALGNHEGEWGSRMTATADNLPVWDTVIRKLYYPNPIPDRFFAGNSNSGKFVGQRENYYAWEWGNALFVVLDPYWNTPQSPEQSGNWPLTLGRTQYEWLKRTLESSKATFKFVFCHNLVGGRNLNGTGQMRGGVEAAKYLEWGGYNLDNTWGFDTARPGWAMPIHQLLLENKVTIFFHGHDHFYGKQNLDGIGYQEIPQPSARNTDLGNRAASYGYTQGTLLGGTGYLRMRVSPSQVTIDYVQTWIPANENGSRKNRVVADSYTITAAAQSSLGMSLKAGGVAENPTVGAAGDAQTGYAVTSVQSGNVPHGTAVFSYIQNGVTVSEAAVPASPPTASARLFVDFGVGVVAGPARLAAGTVNVNTGFAVVNPAGQTAHVTWTLRDRQGQTAGIGHGNLDPGSQHALFIDEIRILAPDLVLPAGFLQTMRYGSLQIDSDQALSITALRMITSQRSDTLFTSIPIADLTQPGSASALYFPQFGNGDGYTTSLFLLNTSDRLQTGSFHFYADDGLPLTVGSLDGFSGSTFSYRIPPGGAYVFQTDAQPTLAQVGTVQLNPDPGTDTPAGAGTFNHTVRGILVTETGISSATATAHARVFVDSSWGHDSGLAIAAINGQPVSVTLQAYESDGITAAGDRSVTQDLPGNGHKAQFISQWISGLPANFRGVLDISSLTPIVALTLRFLINQNDDFLLTTFPVADLTRAAPTPVIFPHLADAGGYRTEFILLSAGGSAEVQMSFLSPQGAALPIVK